MRSIKTIVIVNDFDYVQGGASKVSIDTAELLSKENFKVYFFSGVSDGKVKNNKNINYISTNQGETLKDKNKLRGIMNGIYNLKAKKEFIKLLNELDNKETIIHIHGWTKCLSSSIFDIAFKKRFKVVLTLHDYFTACPNGGYFDYKTNEICKLNPLSLKCIKCNCDSRSYLVKIYRVIRQFMQNKIVKLNDRLEYAISISNFSENILKQTLGKNVKITRIYNPINVDENEEIIDISNNQYYLYVGRISKEKGVDLFCKAITELGYKGIIVGDGEEKEKLEKEYSNIEFTGWKSKREVEGYMKGAKALIFPSKWYETAGLTILESQAIGVPCVVSASCAGAEFIEDGKDGLIFNVNDENDVKSKIKKISYMKYYKNNRLKLYNGSNYIEQLKKMYEDV